MSSNLSPSVNQQCKCIYKPCSCENYQVKELYRKYYGKYEDHLAGLHNVGQHGKLPELKGPKLWVPPWLDFEEKAPVKIVPIKPEVTECASTSQARSSMQINSGKPEEIDVSNNTLIEICKCGDQCYTNHTVRKLSDEDLLMPNHSESKLLRKTKKNESIIARDIVQNTLLTPSVILARLDSKMKLNAPPSYNILLSFIQVAIKAIRIKILRYKHRSKFAAINFSANKKQIVADLNDIFVSTLMYSGCCYQIYARGDEDVRMVPSENQGGFIVCFTSLSGKLENLEYGLDCGMIFSIYKRDVKLSPFAPRTANLSHKYFVSSGYAIYSSRTTLVMSIGKKLYSFTHDPVVEEFVLNDDNIKIPDKSIQISVDEGHSGLWEPQILEYMKRKKDPKLGRPLKTRYSACLVSDFHRTLYSGGIYLYPANRKHPQGKTTLLCECIPLAHIIELAGGAASTGKTDVLKTEADHLGQYIPLFIGSKQEVQELLLVTSSPSRG